MKNLSFFLILTLGLCLAGGCAGSKTGDATPPQPAKATATRPPEPAAKAGPAAAAKSVFAMDENARDPFFPRKKPAAGNASGASGAPQQTANLSELPSLLSAGLQAIGGTPDRRIAIINNVILEEGRSTVIPISAPNHNRPVPVKCRDITRDTVTLDVEGYGQVVVTRKQIL